MEITTLVPAYKSQYLTELLVALQNQTLKPTRIVFSDDSPDQAFIRALSSEEIRSAFAGLNMQVVVGPQQGAWANFRHLLLHHAAGTEFFHLLLDDDIPYPEFYERHAQAHSLGQAACVVSRRWSALESGQPFASLPVPQAISGHPQRMLALSADLLFPHIVPATSNWLGEFSNATFRASMREELLNTQIAGIRYTGLEDIGAFLVASLTAPLILINEHLGYFRTSPGQNTSQPTGRIFKLGVLAWIPLALAARRLQKIDAAQCAAVAQRIAQAVLQHYSQDEHMTRVAHLALSIGPQDDAADAHFLDAWNAFCELGDAAGRAA